MKPIISVDFDGTIHSYENGWQGGKIYGTVTTGFFKWLIHISQKYQVHVFSTRSSDKKLKKEMEDWLNDKFSEYCKEHNIYIKDTFLFYPDSKPKAVLSIDDRSVRFQGIWDTTIKTDTWQNDEIIYKEFNKFLDTLANFINSNNDQDGDKKYGYSMSSDETYASERPYNISLTKLGIYNKFSNIRYSLNFKNYNDTNLSFVLQNHAVFGALSDYSIVSLLFRLLQCSNFKDIKDSNAFLDFLESDGAYRCFFKDVKPLSEYASLTKLYLKYS